MKKFFLGVLIILIGVAIYYFLPESKIPEDKRITRIVVMKKDHKMEVYDGDDLLKRYSVSLIKKPETLDDFEDRSPSAGEYFIFDKDARSKYHKSIGFSPEPYKPAADPEKDKRKRKRTGFRIHGMKRGYGFIGKFHRWTDWTKGGIAVTDDEIDDIFKHVEEGTSVMVKD